MKDEELATVFKALGSEQRIRIIEKLREWEGIDACCGGVLKAFTRIAEETNISRSTLSHHLKELESAGLIVCERQGQATRCKVNEDLLCAVKEFF